MPDAETLKRAERDAEEGKAPSTQAGEFVREEIHHIREGKHGARSTKQAIAIGLSKARRAGVDLAVPAPGTVPENTRRQALRERTKARRAPSRGTAASKASKGRSRGALKALKKEGRAAASPAALARHARAAARQHTPAQRRAAARKGTRTRARTGTGR